MSTLRTSHHSNSRPSDLNVSGYRTFSGVSRVLSKAPTPTLLSRLPFSKLSEESSLQSWKARCPMERTLLGMTIYSRLQLAKQKSPMLSRCEFNSKTTSRSYLQPQKTHFPSIFTLLEMISFSIPVLPNQ